MKNFLLFLVVFFLVHDLFAQNVGIGTDNPLSRLHVSTNGSNVLLIENTQLLDADTTTGLYFKTGSGNSYYTGAIKTIGKNPVEARLGLYTFANVTSSGLQERLSILDNGNVGIGTTTPSNKLEVAGGISASSLFVNGQVQLTYSSGAGKVLTSDQTGVASWVTPAGSHYIGESYGGGIVFYVYDNGTHGLIAATSDQSGSIQWYNGSNLACNAPRTGINGGLANTNCILLTQGAGSYAAAASMLYTGGGFSDWGLPTKDELNLLHLHKDVMDGTGLYGTYWSSTEESNDKAWYQNFCGCLFDGAQGNSSKSYYYPVRSVRSF